MTAPSLGKRAIRSSALSMATQGIRLVSLAITMAVLARFLSTEEFGLAAIAGSLQVFLNAFRDGGLANALIQRTELDESHRSSAFWVNLAGGGVLASLLVVCAPWVAKAYGEDALQPIVACMAIPLMAQVLGAVQEALLRKELAFGKLLVAHSVSALGASAAAIAAGAAGWGVWSLVVRLALMPSLLALVCWGLSTWRPRLLFRWNAVTDLWSVGIYMFLGGLAGFGLTQLDAPIIASVAGVSAAGIFFMARQGALMAIQEATNAIARVLFPYFSVIQQDPRQMATAYERVVRALALLGGCIVSAVIALAPEAVRVVLGERWHAVVPVARVLALQGLTIGISYPAAQLLNARARTRVVFNLALIRGASVLGAFAIGAHWGAIGAAWGWTFARTLNAAPLLWVVRRELPIDAKQVMAGIGQAVSIAGATVLLTRLAAHLWHTHVGAPGVLSLLSLAVWLAVVYAALAYLIARPTLRQLRRSWASR